MSCSGSAERHEFLRARVDSSLLNARTSRFETSHIRSVIFTPSILPALNMRRTYPPLQPASSAACVIVIMLRSSLAMSATLATQRIRNVRTHTCTSSVRCKISASPPNRSGGHGTTRTRTTLSRTEFMRTRKQAQLFEFLTAWIFMFGVSDPYRFLELSDWIRRIFVIFPLALLVLTVSGCRALFLV